MTQPHNHSDSSVPGAVRVVEISKEPVELHKILKFEGMVASGGQAKVVIGAGQVRVNGNVETQKRKKIVAGDTIEFNNEKIDIKLASTATTEECPPKANAESAETKQVIEESSGDTAAIDVEDK